MMTPEVSVIVPVYGVERYIRRCLDSLFGQTMGSRMEFIFIDDKSPDNSVSIIESAAQEYAIRDDQLIIIRHKENHGVGSSRQEGLEVARGEYIIHCDPDDWVDKEAYEELYREAKRGDFDMVICDYKEIFEDNRELIFVQKMESMTTEEMMKGIASGALIGSTWNKLIRKDKALKEKFHEKVSFCEDSLYMFSLLSTPLKISYIGKAFYNYLKLTPGSLTKTRGLESLKSDINLMVGLNSLIKRYPTTKPYVEQFMGRIMVHRIFGYNSHPDIKKLRPYRKCISRDKSHTFFDRQMAKLALTLPYSSVKWLRYHSKSCRRAIRKIIK